MALRKRTVLLRAYRGWLRREDLEDCYSQATLELLLRARVAAAGGAPAFEGPGHIANALEQKLRSRIHDRRRALTGRSAIEAALAGALSLGEEGELEPPDVRATVEDIVDGRLRLRRLLQLARGLTPDQRLVLGARIGLGMGARELSGLLGWSTDKYRKVDQRGRARLRELSGEVTAIHRRSGGLDGAERRGGDAS